MVKQFCKVCNKEVEAEQMGKRFKCPECKMFVATPDEFREQWKAEAKEEAQKQPKKDVTTEVYPIASQKGVILQGKTLGVAQNLIENGVANNLNDLANKSIDFMGVMSGNPQFTSGATGFEDDLKNKLKEVKMAELDKKLDSLKRGSSNNGEGVDFQQMMDGMMKQRMLDMLKGGSTSTNDIMQFPMQMMAMKLMAQNIGGGGNGSGIDPNQLFQMMQITQMANAMGGNKGNDPKEQMLMQQLTDMKNELARERESHQRQMEMQMMMKQFEELAKQGKTDGMTIKDFMGLWQDRDKSVKEKDMIIQSQRDEFMRQIVGKRIEDLENAVASGQGMKMRDIGELKTTLSTLKDLAKELGTGQGLEKSGWEKFSDVVNGLGGMVKPALEAYAQAQANKPPMPMMQMPQQQMMPTMARAITDVDNADFLAQGAQGVQANLQPAGDVFFSDGNALKKGGEVMTG